MQTFKYISRTSNFKQVTSLSSSENKLYFFRVAYICDSTQMIFNSRKIINYCDSLENTID